MSFQDLQLRISYISCGDNNIADAFLNPALKYAKLYRRSVGFFSSSAIRPIIDGIVALSRNRGNIQLVASPKLSEEDIRAIELGYKEREAVLSGAFDHDFIEAISELDDDRLQLLASLIANDTLDIKIAVTERLGIYHDKLGILTDFEGNTIAFFGSPNETYSGYKENYEKIRLLRSWRESDQEGIDDECQEFDSLWNGTNPYLSVYDYTASARKNILTVISQREAGKGAAEKAPIVLRDYQKEAIDAWVANGYHGFYVMATGTGKTWTAIYSALRLLEDHPALIVIAAPYKHLVRQWSEDVIKVLPEATIIMISSENATWDQQLSQAIVRQRLNPNHKIVAISTIKSFYSDRFINTIRRSKQEKMLIVDEAHRFTKQTEDLHSMYQYMLGLSATPFSGKNVAKGEELMQFFGGQVFNLPIETALEKHFLVDYYYYPIYVHATANEENRFRKLSAQIAGCFRNNVCIDPENLVKYLRGRLRIISMAEEKRIAFDEILSHVQENDHFIVYCGDGKLYDNKGDEEIRHIQFVKRKLSEKGFKPSQFTATENMEERMDLVESFNEGAIDALAAIRCLDEGINIPSIKGALILSSNDDYREFVQRRGRILRKYGDKAHANIYDVVVLPSYETTKMAEIEFRRFYEYARLAKNSDELLSQLSSLAAGYGLALEDFVTTFDEGKEAELDD